MFVSNFSEDFNNLINVLSVNTNIDHLVDQGFLMKSDNETINKFAKLHTNMFLYNLILNDNLDIDNSLIKLSNNNQTMNYYEIIKNVHSFFFKDMVEAISTFQKYSLKNYNEIQKNEGFFLDELDFNGASNYTPTKTIFFINEIIFYKKSLPGIDFNSNYEISQKGDDVQKYLYHFIPEINEKFLYLYKNFSNLSNFILDDNYSKVYEKPYFSGNMLMLIDKSRESLISNTKELTINELPFVTTSSEEVVNELSSEISDLPLVTTSSEEVVNELSSKISDLPLVITSSEEVVNELSSEVIEDNSELITEDIDSETSSESTNNTNNSWKNFFFNMFSFNYNPGNYINNFFLFTRGILRFFNFWS